MLLLQLHEDIQVLTRTAIDISQSLKSLQVTGIQLNNTRTHLSTF